MYCRQQNNLDYWNSREICSETIQAQVVTDASGLGWGATYGSHVASGDWNRRVSYLTSNEREMLAILMAIKAFAKLLRGQVEFRETSAKITFFGIKNDTSRSGFEVELPRASNVKLDSVQTLQDHIERTDRFRLPGGPVFLSLRAPYNAIQASSVAKILDEAIKLAGLEGQGYTAKSFRPTGATTAIAQNINPEILMEEAGKKLIGEYDFCNFCKFNVKDGITNYVRKIMEVEVKTLDETDDGFTMCELTIVWRAFLWHQIRSIFYVLVLVGKGKESVEDDSSEEDMTSRKRQRLEIDKPSHIDDKPFGTLDKPKSGENKDPHIIYGENNKEDDDTVRDIDGETTSMKADKDICDSKTSLKDNGEENLETSENGMKGGEKVTILTNLTINLTENISRQTQRAFCVWEENLPVNENAELAEKRLLQEYKKKLVLDGDVVPDPFSISSGWKGEKAAVNTWPSIYITDIATYLGCSTTKDVMNRVEHAVKTGATKKSSTSNLSEWNVPKLKGKPSMKPKKAVDAIWSKGRLHSPRKRARIVKIQGTVNLGFGMDSTSGSLA
ncbi:PUS3-like protein [Mya arenaria]|uniref:PUS3-like protein n=1 Tax=Mya arenaria TaxID=6604 RepID=A0ABY7EZS8_MYAAR|nr:PUS3-like protein [Mya arenaria]